MFDTFAHSLLFLKCTSSLLKNIICRLQKFNPEWGQLTLISKIPGEQSFFRFDFGKTKNREISEITFCLVLNMILLSTARIKCGPQKNNFNTKNLRYNFLLYPMLLSQDIYESSLRIYLSSCPHFIWSFKAQVLWLMLPQDLWSRLCLLLTQSY